MNLKHASDVSAIAAAMLMDDEERDIFGRLPIGSAVVKLQGRWTRPFQVKIPLRSIQKGCIDDCQLIQRMTELGAIVPNPLVDAPKEEKELVLPEASAHELRFLEDVVEHPLSGVVQRYKRLGTNRRKGNAWKHACVSKGLVSVAEVSTSSGKVVLLQPTDAGVALLRAYGHTLPDTPRRGSQEHEYWKHKIAEMLQASGYEVVLEEPVNGYTDIMVTRNGKSCAIEIETGKSDWRANMEKNVQKGFERIIIVPTNEGAQRKIRAELANSGRDRRVQVIPAQNFSVSRNQGLLSLESSD
jgi:hypothetical protein